MRCPYCESGEDKVVDSRLAEGGRAIRRRRECIGCGRRYTTFERAEEVPLLIAKRSGEEEPFDRDKVIEGVRRACKNRPVSEADILTIAEDVQELDDFEKELGLLLKKSPPKAVDDVREDDEM